MCESVHVFVCVSVSPCVCISVVCVSVSCVGVHVCVCMCLCVCACVCACVLPHVCVLCNASMQCMCTFRGPDGDTMYVQRFYPWTINVQKAWYTNCNRIS